MRLQKTASLTILSLLAAKSTSPHIFLTILPGVFLDSASRKINILKLLALSPKNLSATFEVDSNVDDSGPRFYPVTLDELCDSDSSYYDVGFPNMRQLILVMKSLKKKKKKKEKQT